jgi:hypothetical protein
MCGSLPGRSPPVVATPHKTLRSTHWVVLTIDPLNFWERLYRARNRFCEISLESIPSLSSPTYGQSVRPPCTITSRCHHGRHRTLAGARRVVRRHVNNKRGPYDYIWPYDYISSGSLLVHV